MITTECLKYKKPFFPCFHSSCLLPFPTYNIAPSNLSLCTSPWIYMAGKIQMIAQISLLHKTNPHPSKMVTSLSSQFHVAKRITQPSLNLYRQMTPGILKFETEDQGYLHKPKSKWSAPTQSFSRARHLSQHLSQVSMTSFYFIPCCVCLCLLRNPTERRHENRRSFMSTSLSLL